MNDEDVETEIVMACRWVDDARLEALRALMPVGTPLPYVYPGSVERPCDDCGEAIWVGPRGQLLLDLEDGAAAMVCFGCAAVRAREADGYTLSSLGNTYKPHA